MSVLTYMISIVHSNIVFYIELILKVLRRRMIIHLAIKVVMRKKPWG